MRKLTTQEFIEKAKKIHGDKYDYSKVEYIKSGLKVCIICPKHGEFWQIANSHLQGQGCPECNSRNKPITKEYFVQQAIKIHGNRYDYSKVPDFPGGLDILLTHDVVYGYADQSLQDIGWGTEEHFGTVELRDAILEKKPKLHLSGHIHTADHNLIMIGDTKHYNVSYLDEKYTPTFEPLYLDI